MSNDSSSDPETIFTIVSKRFSLSPGLIRSGENPTLKSSPHFKPDSSKIGIQISSVTPGYTVDSKTTIDPLVKFCPTVLEAHSSGFKFGILFSVIGVGTATI